MRPTEEQIEALLEFLEKNPGISKGHLRTAMGKLQTKRKWQDLSIHLNSLGGAVKDGPSWAKFWTDKKYALKKLQTARNQSANRTGGGQDFLPVMSPIEERMLSLLGGSRFATGDKEHAVPLIHNEDMEPIVVACSPVECDAIELSEPGVSVPQSSLSALNASPPRPMQPDSPPSPAQAHNSTQRKYRRHKSGRPYPSRGISQLQIERDRFMDIEAKRVEAELLQAQNTASIACAISRLADAVTNISQSINILVNHTISSKSAKEANNM